MCAGKLPRYTGKLKGLLQQKPEHLFSLHLKVVIWFARPLWQEFSGPRFRYLPSFSSNRREQWILMVCGVHCLLGLGIMDEDGKGRLIAFSFR